MNYDYGLDSGSRVSIAVDCKNIRFNTDLTDEMKRVVDSLADTKVLVNDFSDDMVMFTNISGSRSGEVRAGLEAVAKSNSSLDITIGKAALSGAFDAESLGDDNAKTFSGDTKTLRLRVLGNRSVLDFHRIVEKLCEKYGGERESMVIDRSGARKQRDEGFQVKNIPTENFEYFLKALDKTAHNNVEIDIGDKGSRDNNSRSFDMF